MWARLQNNKLYLLVALASITVFVIALGGGLFGQSGLWTEHWQHQAFDKLCHQDPQRSFFISGMPMAVCSRCIGIYSIFAGVWLLVPIAGRMIKQSRTFYKYLLIAVLIINFIDVAADNIGFWHNTLASRYLMGALIGSVIAGMLGSELLKTKN